MNHAQCQGVPSALTSVRRESPRAYPFGARSLLLLAILAACAGSRGGPIPYDVQNFGPPDTDVVQTVEADYKIWRRWTR